jgi:hypothetical protein
LGRSKIRNLKIRARQRTNFGRTQTPYLSGDSIASLAVFVIVSEKKRANRAQSRARQAKSLFVRSHELELLDFNHFPNLRVLIAGNSDHNFDVLPPVPAELHLLILQNSSIQSEKVQTLPMGLENRRLGRFYGHRDFEFIPNRLILHDRVLVPPMSNTNPIRPSTIQQALRMQSLFDAKIGYLSEKNYLELVKGYQFLLCLEGNGYENHRIWESLYLGIFPIMFETKWSITLRVLDLPILFINDLEEVNRDLLIDFHRRNQGYNPKQSGPLWIQYWRNLIQSFSG